jgi:DNA-binding Lrp family transcriptional regulator
VDKLSPTDLKILEILQLEGDISNVQLAERVFLSPSSCLQRVRKLRAQGYISGVAAIVDLKKIANHTIVHCSMRLSEQTSKHYSIFEVTIQKIPEIVECSVISGEYDYLLKFAVRDMQHFGETLNMMLEMNIGIKNHSSTVEVKSVKRTFAMPLRTLLGHTGK